MKMGVLPSPWLSSKQSDGDAQASALARQRGWTRAKQAKRPALRGRRAVISDRRCGSEDRSSSVDGRLVQNHRYRETAGRRIEAQKHQREGNFEAEAALRKGAEP